MATIHKGQRDAARAALRHRRVALQQRRHRAPAAGRAQGAARVRRRRRPHRGGRTCPAHSRFRCSPSRSPRPGKFDAVICLGAIVRGETQHHDYLARSVFDALQQLQVTHHIPIALGVLTTENMEQALRARRRRPGQQGLRGGAHGHRDGQPAAAARMNRRSHMARARSRRRASASVADRTGDERRATSTSSHGCATKGTRAGGAGSLPARASVASRRERCDAFCEQADAGDRAKAFAAALVAGVREQREQIDQLIAGASEHWRFERLSRSISTSCASPRYELLSARRADQRRPRRGDRDRAPLRHRGVGDVRERRPRSDRRRSSA